MLHDSCYVQYLFITFQRSIYSQPLESIFFLFPSVERAPTEEQRNTIYSHSFYVRLGMWIYLV